MIQLLSPSLFADCSVCGLLRKRKREIFEEDEELSESEYDKLKTQIATCRTTWAWTRMIQVWLKPVQTHSLAICFVSTVFHCQPSLFFGGGS